MIPLTVHLFARARELAGTPRLEVSVPEGTTVGELRRLLAGRVPALAALLERCAVAIDRDFAGDDRVLTAGAEVALIPPVSGG